MWIFPSQGLNQCPPHQQTDSQPLDHQGSLITPCFLKHCFPLLISHLLVWSPLLNHISSSVSSPELLSFEVLLFLKIYSFPHKFYPHPPSNYHIKSQIHISVQISTVGHKLMYQTAYLAPIFPLQLGPLPFMCM